jgi:hypothetical protein
VIVSAWLPAAAFAQEQVSMSPRSVIEGDPVVSVAPIFKDVIDRPSTGHTGALADAIARLRPLADQLRQDARIQRTGIVAGLTWIAVGALRGRPSLTAAGVQALRFGLNKPLSDFRRRSRLSVEPSVGPRYFVITLRRTFD